MKICDWYGKGKPVISFEIFPPKPSMSEATIFGTLEKLGELNPAFISVTYGAGGSSAERSIAIASKVKNQYGVETMAHLTCVNANRDQIDEILHQLAEQNIENVLALRGDPPAGEAEFRLAAGGYQYARDLVRHIKERPQFCVAAAAYPEGHMECRNADEDVAYLKEKCDQGVDFLITQLFFDNQLFYRFRERALSKGIVCPIAAGIMPVFNASQIQRITSLCGASIPDKLQTLISKYAASPSDMEKAGIEYACEQINNLAENHVEGIHLYTMNKADQTKQIVREAGLI